MIVTIKDTQVEAKHIQSIGLLISDADCNKIINRKTRVKRGRLIAKEKLVDTSTPYRFNNTVYYPLIEKLDDCYFNNVMIGK
jgi:hypothetical protein